MILTALIVAFVASLIGSISGMGGGIIIKPVLESINIYPLNTISFLSSTTVVAMTISSFIRDRKSDVKIDLRVSMPIALGAAIGGIFGSEILTNFRFNLAITQNAMLLLINIFVLIYIINKNRVKTHKIKSIFIIFIVGLLLGTISSFLGIGGGPINIALLYYLFSMDTKNSVKYSLFIILFSQLAGLITLVLLNQIPEYDLYTLITMIIGGVTGAVAGSYISKKLSHRKIEKLFIIVLCILILINGYNLFVSIL